MVRASVFVMSESSLREQVAAADPARFSVPAYLGAKGWVGVRPDVGRVDWAGIRELITDAYRLQAPRTLVAQLDG